MSKVSAFPVWPEFPLLPERFPRHVTSKPEVRHGSPCVVGTGIRVVHMVRWLEQDGCTAREIAESYGVSEADVYGALAFYHDNKAALDAHEAAREEWAEASQAEAGAGAITSRRRAG